MSWHAHLHETARSVFPPDMSLAGLCGGQHLLGSSLPGGHYPEQEQPCLCSHHCVHRSCECFLAQYWSLFGMYHVNLGPSNEGGLPSLATMPPTVIPVLALPKRCPNWHSSRLHTAQSAPAGCVAASKHPCSHLSLWAGNAAKGGRAHSGRGAGVGAPGCGLPSAAPERADDSPRQPDRLPAHHTGLQGQLWPGKSIPPTCHTCASYTATASNILPQKPAVSAAVP